MSATTNANFFPTIGNVVEGQPTTRAEGEEEQQLVQEIESLCMSCHEQVRISTELYTSWRADTVSSRGPLVYSSPLFPTSARSSWCLSDVNTAEPATTRSNQLGRSDVSLCLPCYRGYMG
jgi:hypothetical protein